MNLDGMDDKGLQRLFKTVTAQLTEVFDNLPAGLRPDIDHPGWKPSFEGTLKLHDGCIAFGSPTHGFYRAPDGRAWWWEREPGPQGTVVVEYEGGLEVGRALVAKPPELN